MAERRGSAVGNLPVANAMFAEVTRDRYYPTMEGGDLAAMAAAAAVPAEEEEEEEAAAKGREASAVGPAGTAAPA